MTLTQWIRNTCKKQHSVIGQLIREAMATNKNIQGVHYLGFIDFSPNSTERLDKLQNEKPVQFKRMWFSPSGSFFREEKIMGIPVSDFYGAKSIRFDDWGPDKQGLVINYKFFQLHPFLGDSSILFLDDDNI